jgi:hypothetical protein
MAQDKSPRKFEGDPRVGWPVLGVFILLSLGYFSYPYCTLYRLDFAMRHADAATLRSLVDWYAVREGLKEDLCDMATDEPGDVRQTNELPPFGAGFMRGIALNVVDRTVTAETLAGMTRTAAPDPASAPHLIWAFFDNPTQFAVEVRAGGGAPIHMVMQLRDLRWQVRRVWLTNEMLGHAGD